MTDSNPDSSTATVEAAQQGIKIAGFLCNWCSYGGADTAGVCRFKQPTDLRIVPIPCTGRMDPLFVAKSLVYGVDGCWSPAATPRTVTMPSAICTRAAVSRC